MSRKFHLQPLLDLAGIRSDSRGSELTQLRTHLNGAEQKLNQLEDYRRDYTDGLSEKMRAGMDADRLREYQVFLSNLDHALMKQREEVARWTLAWDAARLKWVEARREFRAYDVLSDRHKAAEAIRETRIEQKEHDELTATRPGVRDIRKTRD